MGSSGTIKTLFLSDHEQKVLDTILDFYIRVGLGQVAEVPTHLKLLASKRDLDIGIKVLLDQLQEELFKGDKPWKLEDPETAAGVIVAFAIQAKLLNRKSDLEWATRKLREMRGEPL